MPIQSKPVAQVVSDELTGRITVMYTAPEAPRYAVPSRWNFSRFLANVIELEECLGLVTGMIETLRAQLMEVLPDFGCNLGYDGRSSRVTAQDRPVAPPARRPIPMQTGASTKPQGLMHAVASRGKRLKVGSAAVCT